MSKQEIQLNLLSIDIRLECGLVCGSVDDQVYSTLEVINNICERKIHVKEELSHFTKIFPLAVNSSKSAN